jgi:hypothetical protein
MTKAKYLKLEFVLRQHARFVGDDSADASKRNSSGQTLTLGNSHIHDGCKDYVACGQKL